MTVCCVSVNPADIELQEHGECVRGGDSGKEGERGLDTEENNSGTCTGNTSIFSTSPLRAKQKHELNDFGRGEWECVCVCVYVCAGGGGVGEYG